MLLHILITCLALLLAPAPHDMAFPLPRPVPGARQTMYEMIVRDTTLVRSSKMVHTFSINGQVPPKILPLKPNDPAMVRFRNATAHELLLSVPEELLTNPLSKKWVTILPGQAFTANLRTTREGIYDYRVTRMEQKDNGISGVITIKQP